MTTLPNVVPTKRLGLITPPSNPTVELELRALCPLACGVYSTRLPLFPGQPLEVRQVQYVEHYPRLIQSFGVLAIDAFMVGITGPSYSLTPEQDVERSRTLSAGAGGRPVIQASMAIRETLAALGADKVFLFSPYPGWLTEKSAAYWSACGFQLAGVFKVSEEFRAYDLTTEEVLDGLAKIQVPKGAVVLMSGTGMATVDAMVRVAGAGGPVLVSSNLACAFAALKLFNLPPSEHFRAASPALVPYLAKS